MHTSGTEKRLDACITVSTADITSEPIEATESVAVTYITHSAEQHGSTEKAARPRVPSGTRGLAAFSVLPFCSALWVVYLTGYAAIRARIAFLQGSRRQAVEHALEVLVETQDYVRATFRTPRRAQTTAQPKPPTTHNVRSNMRVFLTDACL